MEEGKTLTFKISKNVLYALTAIILLLVVSISSFAAGYFTHVVLTQLKQTPPKLAQKFSPGERIASPIPENKLDRKSPFEENVFRGELSQVTQNSFRMNTPRGEIEIEIQPETAIQIGENEGTLSDLKPGQRITVLAENSNGKLVAKRIIVIPF